MHCLHLSYFICILVIVSHWQPLVQHASAPAYGN
jgi:hypothetical protein